MAENPHFRMWAAVPNCPAKPEISVLQCCFAFRADAWGSSAVSNILGLLLHGFRVCEALWLTTKEMARGRFSHFGVQA
jgi:hypothetical protein